jgi:hypothetical protein
MTGRFRCRVAGAIAIAIGISAGISGCAKSSTSVYALIDADATVPPVLILRVLVASSADPSMRAGSELSSWNTSDAADRPGPFLFPMGLPITVSDTLAGPVTITVEGLDWDTHAVIARSTVSALVAAERQTFAMMTLSAVAGGSNDGGIDAAP